MRWKEQTKRKREPLPSGFVHPGMANRFSAATTIEPGQWVVHPDCPDWGSGQVQSVVGSRVTVNFENQGKVLINTDRVDLLMAD